MKATVGQFGPWLSTNQVGGSRDPARVGAPLSTSADGRQVAVGAVGGADRCDPGAAVEDRPAACDDAIERRADEFAPPPRPPEQTTEQRLLQAGARAEASPDANDAARRLGQARGAAGDLDGAAAAVASGLASGGAAMPPQPPGAQAIDALIQAITSTTGAAITVIPPGGR